jgi:alpha-1,3-mannosyltransferase
MVYLLNLRIVHSIYKTLEPSTGKIPLILCSLSYKMHSIYLLRVFNDPVVMVFMNLCVLSAIKNKWKTSLVLYSIALSIKMNILLYLPGLLLCINWGTNYVFTLLSIFFIVSFQLIIAAPFIAVNSSGYFTMAFDFSRIFIQKESAYWQFLSNGIFVSRTFHIFLLALHVLFLLVFLVTKAADRTSFKRFLVSLNLPVSLDELQKPAKGCVLTAESNL